MKAHVVYCPLSGSTLRRRLKGNEEGTYQIDLYQVAGQTISRVRFVASPRHRRDQVSHWRSSNLRR